MDNLKEKPFALIGVNVNSYDAKKLKEIMVKEKINWRSLASRDTAKKWNASTPTYYVLDREGVIRHKWVGSPGAKAIDMALEKLIHEAEGNGKNKPKTKPSR